MLCDELTQLTDRLILAGRNVTVGDIPPASPLQSDIFIEPASIYPLWVYNTGIAKWLSPVLNFGGQMPQIINTAGSVTRGFFGFQDSGSYRPIVIRRLIANIYLPPSGTLHSATNYLTFQAYWRSLSGAASTLNSGGIAISWNTSSGYGTLNRGYTFGSQVNASFNDIMAIQIDASSTGAAARPEVNIVITGQVCRS